MPFSSIDKPSKYFDTKLYTGTGATQSITGLNFSPDFVWLKSRGEAQDHYLFDSIRTATKALSSNLTLAEQTYSDSLTSFNSDGFTLGASTRVNKNTFNHVGWCWDANGTGVSNTQGTLTATVSANTTSGFSICKITEASSYSGVQTFGHGLGVAPSMVIYRMSNTGSNWQVYHKSTGVNITQLNNTNATSSGTSYFPAVSSTTVSVGEGIQGPTYTSIAYCFAEVKGFSKFGSYTGNGSTDGTFVYTGFKPKFFLAKRTDTTNSWTITNSSNQSYNQADTFLLADSSQAESTATSVDYLSNGVKIRSIGAWGNASGGTYIYMAFAENPFVSSKGIPCTAR